MEKETRILVINITIKQKVKNNERKNIMRSSLFTEQKHKENTEDNKYIELILYIEEKREK